MSPFGDPAARLGGPLQLLQCHSQVLDLKRFAAIIMMSFEPHCQCGRRSTNGSEVARADGNPLPMGSPRSSSHQPRAFRMCWGPQGQCGDLGGYDHTCRCQRARTPRPTGTPGRRTGFRLATLWLFPSPPGAVAREPHDGTQAQQGRSETSHPAKPALAWLGGPSLESSRPTGLHNHPAAVAPRGPLD